jgi:hypothetical protein
MYVVGINNHFHTLSRVTQSYLLASAHANSLEGSSP